jgi:hypothetical protein
VSNTFGWVIKKICAAFIAVHGLPNIRQLTPLIRF